MWTYRRILKISWKDQVTNENVKIMMEVSGPNLATRLWQRKLNFAGHVMRGSSGSLTSLVLEGLVNGKEIEEGNKELVEMTSRSGPRPVVLASPRGSLRTELGGVVWFGCKHLRHRIALDDNDDDLSTLVFYILYCKTGMGHVSH